MSSTASPESTFRPWHFFTLAALLAATAGVFLLRGTSPSSVILISAVIGGAGFVGVAVYRMLAPLVTPRSQESSSTARGRARLALEEDKAHLLRSIKELEFDRAMNKISAEDHDEMVARLRARAVRLIRQLDEGGSGYREIIEQELASRLGRAVAAKREQMAAGEEPLSEETAEPVPAASARRAGAGCGSCGTANEADARFCKHCGSRLAALLLALGLGLATLAGSQPAWAQPNLRMMAGIPRPDGNLSDGVITVRVVREALANNITGLTVELVTDADVITAVTDEEGRATFVAPASGTIARARAVVDGETLESQTFPAPGRGGVAVMLVAGLDNLPAIEAQPGQVTLGPESRVVVDLVDDALQIYYVFDILNPSTSPVTPPEPVIFELPTGASGAGALAGSSPQVVVLGDHVTVTPPFAPGLTPVEVAFILPHASGELMIEQPLPVDLRAVNLIMRRVGQMGLVSGQFANQQEQTFQGVPYLVAAGPPIAAGGTLRFTLTGLPHRSTMPRTIAAVLVGAIFLLGAWAVLVGPPGTSADSRRRQQLEARREKLYQQLISFDAGRRAGQDRSGPLQARRESLIGQLERIYADLDTLEGGSGGTPA